MIESITLKDYKSYKSAEILLGPLTMFIGANASGKSNALEALRLLSWLAKGSRLDDIERNIQGADSLVRGQAKDLFRRNCNKAQIGCHTSSDSDWGYLDIEIGLIDKHLILTGESVKKKNDSRPLYKITGTPSPHSDEISVLYNNFKRGGRKPHIPCSNRQAIFYQLQTPSRFDKNHTTSQHIIPEVAKTIRTALQNILFLDPRPSLMRDYSHANADRLNEDGSNLSGILFNICQNSTDKQLLLQFIQSLPEQSITDIQFIKTERADVMVRLVESFGSFNEPVDAPLLSDGTLRVLAIAAALLSAKSNSLVIIEEIDNGVHPSRANQLISQIQKVAQDRDLRVLLTSHNPALLDALPSNALADVLCCYRDPQSGDSRIVRLSDMDRYPELIAQGPLGQLMTKRILDKFVKDRTTQEDRKNQQLNWLNSLQLDQEAE